ncbi:hypothetical protein FPV67DRAFT_1422396 [Lyophyllum atratum]|nr:hypothetical protein FPV67DRAFT_1422396 [Lyophyllum atratum]
MNALLASSLPIALLLAWYSSRVRYRIIRIHQTISSIHHVFSPPNASAHDLLVARAAPNARLIRAFSLTNTFVSPSPTIHTAFVGRAALLLKAASERGWPHFQQVAIDAVAASLVDFDRLKFDVFVQEVTMRVALVGLLGVDVTVDELDACDISIVATNITLLWSLSKKPEPIPLHLLPQLNHHLRRLIPDEVAYPNPLDYLIPVWETLWRVVATTVAYAHRNVYVSNVLAELHDLPTVAQFRAYDDLKPSAEWCVTEVMRLHPPSKHITRASPNPPIASVLPWPMQFLADKVLEPLAHHECADIGTVLRSEDIWGEDADAFNPLRYQPNRITREQERIKWLAFGHGRYKCVAAAWAPMAAGIISSAIVDRLNGDSGRHLVAGNCIGTREGWKGWEVSRSSGF